MDLLSRMNKALAYVEANLAGEISNEILAGIACCSAYNFCRMFSFITDISLTEYIRRRRLTLAAIELQCGSAKVIDLALKYGYDSPVSFARAFRILHGVTPTQARSAGVTLKAYPRISFQISVKGVKEMDYRIESKEAFQIFGIEGIFTNDGIGEFPRTPHELWDHNHACGAYEKLAADAGGLPPFVASGMCKVHGAFDYRPVQPGAFAYMQCAFRSESSRVDGYTIAHIPAHTWVVLPSERFDWASVGQVIDKLSKRFFSEWLPAAEYEQVDGISFEVYGGDNDTGYVELWFAVAKKV